MRGRQAHSPSLAQGPGVRAGQARHSVTSTCQRGMELTARIERGPIFRKFSAPRLWQAGCTLSASYQRKLSTEVTVRLLRGLLALLTCLAFSGCVVHGPDFVVKSPVEIKAEREGKFCPPGQAKKGNC
jgi:hypothetical protein